MLRAEWEITQKTRLSDDETDRMGTKAAKLRRFGTQRQSLASRENRISLIS
jgi:hypothetical protein